MYSIFIFLFPFAIANSDYQGTYAVKATEAFLIPISHKWFPGFSQGDTLEYSMSLLDKPDLPHWMFSQTKNQRDAFLYGSADNPGRLVQIEIIALNTNTYQTASRVLELKVENRSSVSEYEVEMKFLNLNVEDMFSSDRLKRLIEIFHSNLWKGSGDIYVTKVVSSLDVGGRLPLNPNMKEGVVVRIGGSLTFSRDLLDLEREVQPLRNRQPCPRDYKRTSVEHLFRSRNFVTDWCSFRLLFQKQERNAGSSYDNTHFSTAITSDEFHPESIELPRRDFALDFIVSIIIPTAIVAIISTALTCIMCCNKEGIDQKCDVTSMQLDHYNSIQHASSDIHRLTVKQDSLQCAGSTPESSFPCSHTDSPSSTLPKGFTLSTGSNRNITPCP
ncbi:epsilon-sarcoglycan isoform X2 [Parasteatoda tepidariorum]|uniref:epsilon-sarcoglycan isoform X2 n=1 Tax=Parasteatoda tepidariorum TaxID=114398 RepID=UPI0039BC9C21